MSRPRQFLVLVVLCGTVALAGWGAAGLGVFGSSGIENSATPIGDRGATRGAVSLSADAGKPVDAPLASAMASVVAVARSHLSHCRGLTSRPQPCPLVRRRRLIQTTRNCCLFRRRGADFEAPLPDSRPTPPPETRVQLASISTSDPGKEYPKPAVRYPLPAHDGVLSNGCAPNYVAPHEPSLPYFLRGCRKRRPRHLERCKPPQSEFVTLSRDRDVTSGQQPPLSTRPFVVSKKNT